MTEETTGAASAERRDGSALSDKLGLVPERDLVERLRLRRSFMSTDAVRWYMTATPDGDCQEAAAEIDRLRAALKHANDQAERFERGWYLRGDALESIKAWQQNYPHATSGLTTIIEQGLKA